MATQTTNYGLTKPSAFDPVDIEVLNENFDVIDEQIKKAADAIPPVATQEVAGIVKPDGTTVTVDPDGTIHGAQTYVLPVATEAVLGGIKIGKNLTVGSDGKLNAYAEVLKDALPTAGSQNVPTSNGTYLALAELDYAFSELNKQVVSLTTGLTWKPAVSTHDDIATAYPAPSVGWTVMCLDTGYAYQWDGSDWIFVMASLVAVASVGDVGSVLEVGT